MKKFLLLAVALILNSTAFAGGYFTNTNQSVAFVRNPARLATMELDGAYSNPAGLAWIGEGLHLSFNWQVVSQERDIESTFAPFAGNINGNGTNTRLFNGDAFAPILPSLDFAYQKGDWTVSAHVGVIGGGGKAKYEDGLPMFEGPISIIAPMLGQVGLSTIKGYSANMNLTGEQYIYAVQAGVTYKFFDNKDYFSLSGHIGGRVSIVNNRYQGYLNDVMVYNNGTAVSPTPYLSNNPAAASLAYLSNGIELDCKQSGVGVAPIVGLDYRLGNVNIGIRYEFKTDITVENDTKKEVAIVPAYNDKVKTDYDIPAILSVGAQWSILPNWRVMAGWNTYFDKNAEMAGGKEKLLRHDTHEVTLGTEVDIKKFTISAGAQHTDYGQSDAFQSDLSFNSDSHSMCVGLRYNVNKHFSVDAGYMRNFYVDYTKTSSNYNSTGMPGSDTYKRENQVFGLGITWHM